MSDNASDSVEMPPQMQYYTVDEVAETVDYWAHLPKDRAEALYSAVWNYLAKSKNPTPLGGDGSNGTVELPEQRLDPENDDKAHHWWSSLDKDWQMAIVKAMAN